jgi:hypothetical protein
MGIMSIGGKRQERPCAKAGGERKGKAGKGIYKAGRRDQKAGNERCVCPFCQYHAV